MTSRIDIWKRAACLRLAERATPCSSLHTEDSSIGVWEAKNRWLRRAGLQIGTQVAIDTGLFVLPYCEAQVTVRDYAVIGHNLRMYAFNKIEIGRFCMFAADVTLTNGGHDPDSFVPFSGPLEIGNGCWIGSGARIVGPLRIGNNAIVAAGAVVVADVPEGAIVGGVPARVLGQRTLPEKVWHFNNTWFCPRTFKEVA